MKPRTTNRRMNNLWVIMKIATAKEFKAHLPQPSLRDCWRAGWARDFEKLEAVVVYQKTTASEDISEVEAQRLQEAVEAATTTQRNSSEILHKFMSDSGDPTISETFREIRIEAATLPIGRTK